jgi:hypothetical protein
MSESSELIERYYTIRKGIYGFLERVELTQNIDPKTWNGFRLEIVLRERAESSSTLKLEFFGVRDITIGELTGLLRYMIEIKSIEDLQTEGSKFKITESEYDAISFTCESFVVVP